MQYVYPAVFYVANEGGYSVDFPDVPGAITCGETLYEAIEMAEDALAIILCAWEDSKSGKRNPPIKNKITAPTPISEVIAEPDEFSKSAFVTLIRVDTDEYRKSLGADE